MTVYYRVYHFLNPNGSVVLAFKEEQTPMRVRDRACRERHFPWSEYTHLAVKKTKQPTKLGDHRELEV